MVHVTVAVYLDYFIQYNILTRFAFKTPYWENDRVNILTYCMYAQCLMDVIRHFYVKKIALSLLSQFI